ncbi:polychome-like protein, partial [Tanacetum coccineum]
CSPRARVTSDSKAEIIILMFIPSNLGKAPVTFADLANWNSRDLEFLIPPKRLLNSVDIIETVVREKLQNLKRTPTTKKVKKEKRVRTLMSMR